MDWSLISSSLKKIYQELNLISYFEKDEKYLSEAFYFTEKLWEDQFDSIDKLNVVMISEAPLFGNIKKYIYNIDTAPSSFFYYQDLNAFPTFNNEYNTVTSRDKKIIMLDEFRVNGFLILDIFPFAFNKHDTALNYRKMSQKVYKKLLDSTINNYLKPKLETCLKKANDDTLFLYRYKRLYKKTGNHFDSILSELSNEQHIIDSISGGNMSLDRDKLRILLEKSIKPN